MKLYERFKTIDHGVPVPLKIPVRSIIAEVLRVCITAAVTVLFLLALSWVNYMYFNK